VGRQRPGRHPRAIEQPPVGEILLRFLELSGIGGIVEDDSGEGREAEQLDGVGDEERFKRRTLALTLLWRVVAGGPSSYVWMYFSVLTVPRFLSAFSQNCKI